ncbi:flavin reductase family protein [Streptomyces sp. NPDC019396]|uniref:flavin reductase family protein n=1 Tax=Streptomyces sp. NPDC019396 TaxID=3154687 RepID=UPI0033C1ACD4
MSARVPVTAPVQDEAGFRQVAGRLPTGVTLLSTVIDGQPHATLVNSFTTVSTDPLLVLVSLSTAGRTCARVTATGAFAVTVLSAEQRDAAQRLADPTRALGIEAMGDDWRPAPHSGAPVFAEGVGYFDCAVEQAHQAGDHTVVIAGVRAFGVLSDRAPLLFVRSRLVAPANRGELS